MAVSTKHMTATIVERIDHAPDLWSIRVRPDEALEFKPGQYVSFGLLQSEKVLERAFSIVSSPHEDQLEFFIERVPGGALSPLLHGLGVGDTVLMRKRAKGVFFLDTTSGHAHHLLVSTVTGIAPYVSMVRTLLRDLKEGRLETPPRVAILHGASHSPEFSYRAEMGAVAGEAPWLTYVGTISRPWEDPGWRGERGRVDDVLRKYCDTFGMEPEDTTTYLCGHPGMIDNARDILRRRGFEKAFIREENYWPGESMADVEY